jgi:Lrp/AsnC family leucine-responsive transcriptional regulator
MQRNSMPGEPLTATDVKLLELLQQNARLSNVTLAKRVGLSPSACLRRVRALEEQRYIRSSVTLLDPRRLGLGVSVFIQVSLEKKDEATLKRFERTMTQRPEVMECYLMTGDSDYLLRVVVSDVAAFERFLMEHLTKIPGIATIKSSFTLNQVKYTTSLPLETIDR